MIFDPKRPMLSEDEITGYSRSARDTRGNQIDTLDASGNQTSDIIAERQRQRIQNMGSFNATTKISLVSSRNMRTGNGTVSSVEDSVVFDITPEISESKQAIYAEISDIRQAASILIYGGSPSRKWSVSAKFVSRTAEEASSNWKNIQLLKSWLNPDAGYTGILGDLGTPHVLKLYGLGRTWQGIPVVITSLNVDYPTDVDSIHTTRIDSGNNAADSSTPVPIIQPVSFQLTEARTPDDLLHNFNLEKFKLGVLPEW